MVGVFVGGGFNLVFFFLLFIFFVPHFFLFYTFTY